MRKLINYCKESFVELTKKDIVRHKLVTRIVEAYEKEKTLPQTPPLQGGE